MRHLSEEERRAHVAEFLERDRQQGFDFRTAPLTRATLFQTGEAEWEFVWSFHHVLADGNTYPALIREAFDSCAAIREGRAPALPRPCAYREFVQWLETHRSENQARAEAFWKKEFQGLASATSLPGLAADCSGQSGHNEKSLRLDTAASSALRALAQSHDLTVNSLVQAAWALVLGTHGDREDVVFGVTRGCRGAFPGAGKSSAC